MHQITQLNRRVLHGALVMLERSAGKLARSVLRGLGEGDLAWLPGEALQRAGKTPQPTVRRVTLLLLAHAGLSNQAIADQVGTSRTLVQKWRKRFALYESPPLVTEEEVEPVARLAALQDLPRSGRPPAFSPVGTPHRRGRGLPRR